MRLFFLSLVVVNPIGPLSVKINSTVTIHCNITDPENHLEWTLIHKNNSVTNAGHAPGFMIIYSTTSSSSLVFRVMDFSITGILCTEVHGIPGDSFQSSGRKVQLLIQGMLIL